MAVLTKHPKESFCLRAGLISLCFLMNFSAFLPAPVRAGYANREISREPLFKVPSSRIPVEGTLERRIPNDVQRRINQACLDTNYGNTERWKEFELARGSEVGNVDASASDRLAVITWEVDDVIYSRRILLTPNAGLIAGSQAWVWQDLEVIASGNVTSGPTVDVGGNNSAIAWIGDSLSSQLGSVFMSSYNGGSWTPREYVNVNATPSLAVSYPEVAVNPAGDILAGWAVGTRPKALELRLKPSGRYWGNIRNATVGRAGEQPLNLLGPASLGFLGNIGIAVTTVKPIPSQQEVQYATLNSSGQFRKRQMISSADSISRPILTETQSGHIACAFGEGMAQPSSTGLFFAATTRSPSDPMDNIELPHRVEAARFPLVFNGGAVSWGTQHLIFTSQPQPSSPFRDALLDVNSAAAAASSDGTMITTWVMTDPQSSERSLTTKISTCSEVFPDLRSWDYQMSTKIPAITPLQNVTDARYFDSFVPSVAIGEKNRPAIAWIEGENGNSRVHYRRFFPRCGKGWTSLGGSAQATGASATDVEVIVLDPVTMLVIWREVTSTEERVRGGIFATSWLSLQPPP